MVFFVVFDFWAVKDSGFVFYFEVMRLLRVLGQRVFWAYWFCEILGFLFWSLSWFQEISFLFLVWLFGDHFFFFFVVVATFLLLVCGEFLKRCYFFFSMVVERLHFFKFFLMDYVVKLKCKSPPFSSFDKKTWFWYIIWAIRLVVWSSSLILFVFYLFMSNVKVWFDLKWWGILCGNMDEASFRHWPISRGLKFCIPALFFTTFCNLDC